MFSQFITCGLFGLDGYRILVETDLSNGLPYFDIVGLADMAVKEARERVRAAISNSGFTFPKKRLIVNLAPADTKKEGAGFDLAIAIGILVCSELLLIPNAQEVAFFGELALDGRLRPVNGTLSKALAAKDTGCKVLVLPAENAKEAAWVKDLIILPASSLMDVFNHFSNTISIKPFPPSEISAVAFVHLRQKSQVQNCEPPSLAKGCQGSAMPEIFMGNAPDLPCYPNTPGGKTGTGSEPFVQDDDTIYEDFSDVKGQQLAKRAIEVAAAGGHHLFMLGGPGAGKTMLSKRIPGILPAPTLEEALEITRIYSVAGMMPYKDGLVTKRPFRSPHHTISNAGLVGGGKIPKPGEISLAHGGVLFLDELPEFGRAALDSLRQPLEEGKLSLARVQATLTYPSRFMLVAAANPCKCGNFGDPTKVCRCAPKDAERYLFRISGPLMDRMDIQIFVPSISYQEMSGTAISDSSETIRSRVEAARKLQLARFSGKGVYCNAQLNGIAMRQACALDAESRQLMERAFTQLSLSMRAHDRILRVARTIADLDGSVNIRKPHLAEAIQYRSAKMMST